MSPSPGCISTAFETSPFAAGQRLSAAFTPPRVMNVSAFGYMEIDSSRSFKAFANSPTPL